MSPSPQAGPQAIGASPLPPLPADLSSAGSNKKGDSAEGMTGIITGVTKSKSDVDEIIKRLESLAGRIPEGRQLIDQIKALAIALLPMVAQKAFMPGPAPGPTGGVPPVGQAGV